jgi:hypothetical protein
VPPRYVSGPRVQRCFRNSKTLATRRARGNHGGNRCSGRVPPRFRVLKSREQHQNNVRTERSVTAEESRHRSGASALPQRPPCSKVFQKLQNLVARRARGNRGGIRGSSRVPPRSRVERCCENIRTTFAQNVWEPRRSPGAGREPPRCLSGLRVQRCSRNFKPCSTEGAGDRGGSLAPVGCLGVASAAPRVQGF